MTQKKKLNFNLIKIKVELKMIFWIYLFVRQADMFLKDIAQSIQ